MGALVIFVVTQALISVGILNDFWYTIIRIGAVMGIVSLGLNLIYGFNGQFSLGQWGFYAIGAYSAADVTYRWTNLHSANGMTVLLVVILFGGAVIIGTGKILSHTPNMDALSQFAIYLVAIIAAVFAGVYVGQAIANPVTGALSALPADVSLQIVFFISVLLAGCLAAEISFIFGLPVLTLGSDYFGIATLGFTVIVKVLLDNSDTMFGFAEMKGARGMIGIPHVTTWAWVFVFLMLVIVITRNLLQSSYGRAIVSVREDEIAAKAMGIDIAFYKTLTFVIGSLYAGLAGGLYAHINGFLHPSTFDFIASFNPLIVVVFGGLGSVTGTVFAAFTWALFLEGVLRLFLPQGFENWRFVVYPFLLLLIMLLRPKGLLGDFEIPYLREVAPALRPKKIEAKEENAPVGNTPPPSPEITVGSEEPKATSEG